MARGSGHIASAREALALMAQDDRILSVHEFIGSISNPTGGPPIERLVAQVRVDVRVYTGIGRDVVVAVGSAYEHKKELERQRRRGRARRSS